jgi:voltage-gated potassium channel
MTLAQLAHRWEPHRLRIQEVIFRSETPAGHAFDKWLLAAILVSVAVVFANSVSSVREHIGPVLHITEWLFTLAFTLEYAARLACAPNRSRYAFSFFGIVDLLSVLPTYLSVVFPEAHALIDLRVVRLLRIFQIFHMRDYLYEYQMLGVAMAASRRKILVFLSAVLMLVVVLGTLLYVVEGPEHGFTDIPTSIYWAITTVTTVGFGDITPKTDFGRLIAAVTMLMGWGTLAVPTGIVTAEMTSRRRRGPFKEPKPTAAHNDGSVAGEFEHIGWRQYREKHGAYSFHAVGDLPAGPRQLMQKVYVRRGETEELA